MDRGTILLCLLFKRVSHDRYWDLPNQDALVPEFRKSPGNREETEPSHREETSR